jgi:hypothetical protein
MKARSQNAAVGRVKEQDLSSLLVRLLGDRHGCLRGVVGGRGKTNYVYCARCNNAAIEEAKEMAISLNRTLDEKRSTTR